MNYGEFKYPKTKHLPFSLKLSKKEDRNFNVENFKYFIGKEVIVTEKVDGGNESLLTDACLPRAMDDNSFMYGHESRNWIKSFWNNIKHDIPEDLIISVENMFAVHTIYYDLLPSYAIGLGVWSKSKNCLLCYDECLEWFSLLNISPAPLLYRGIYDENKIKECFTGKSKLATDSIQEGYVIRLAEEIARKEFGMKVAKFVTTKFEIPDEHWSKNQIRLNKLKEKENENNFRHKRLL